MGEIDLDRYLGPEEKEQLDKLLKKAGKRKLEEEKRNSGKGQEILGFRFCFECGIGERKPEVQRETGENGNVKGPADSMEELYDFQNLLRQMCDFCKKYDLCPECRQEQDVEEEELFEPPI